MTIGSIFNAFILRACAFSVFSRLFRAALRAIRTFCAWFRPSSNAACVTESFCIDPPRFAG
ncbi:hypothetical protein LPW11_07675 [Geomonas sp. RF6]|uniref:hypothetical protein n=1 Tax=Geomonas sp. RF6 TaxID=2897342 RepID=UPI001E54251C|nr:hypothetical protein [Geomonas sp. RF6]UFS72061.1 hypothetical protein LPW11_07675 [Geomonas sp. RF6]